MRTRLTSIALSVALAVPGVGIGVLATALASKPAGAVSTTASWTDTSSGWDRSSSPTIADVNGDGTNDVVIGHQDGWLRVVSGTSGHNLPGWPQKAIISGPNGTAIDSTPAVADLFKNGQKKIIVGVGSTWVHNQQGGVIIFNVDGTRHCVFQTRDFGNVYANTGVADGYSDPVFSSPAVGDINGDGYPDIVFGSFDLRVYAIDRNCNKLIDYNIEDSTWSSPALYDVDGDGRQEIFIGGDQTAGGAINWSGGEFRALKYVPGAPGAVELWKNQINDTIWSSPAIGDIDGDGRVEAVVGAGFSYQRSDGRKILLWHLDDGSPVRGWPVATGGWTMPSPALGDLTGDGIPEVVASSSDGWVHAYRGNGSQLWAKYLPGFNGGPGGGAASPIIADMDGDGHNDVGAGNGYAYFVLRGSNGSAMSELNQRYSRESAGAVGYFGSGGWKLIVDGFDTPNNRNLLQAFSMPAPRITPPWPEFRHDAAHKAGPVGKNLLAPGYCRRSIVPTRHPSSASTQGYWIASANGSIYAKKGAPYKGGAGGRVNGHIVGLAATHSGGGYYLLDSAGNMFTYGDAHSYGSMAGKHLNAPIIAMTATSTGHGYYLLGRDGGVFTFGDARFFGSTGGKRLNAPIISMAATTTGHGYWLLASDGGVFTFGDARFHGSTGSMRLAAPVISMATAPSGKGYWLIARDGGVFSFGVPFYGSIPGVGLCYPPSGVQIRPTLTGKGYFVLGTNGTVWPFGDADSGGGTPALPLSNLAVDLAVRR